MKDMFISLGFTALFTPFYTAYIMGWAWTKESLLNLVTLLEAFRWSVDRFFSEPHEDASDW
jgi:hypothetical protein